MILKELHAKYKTAEEKLQLKRFAAVLFDKERENLDFVLGKIEAYQEISNDLAVLIQDNNNILLNLDQLKALIREKCEKQIELCATEHIFKEKKVYNSIIKTINLIDKENFKINFT